MKHMSYFLKNFHLINSRNPDLSGVPSGASTYCLAPSLALHAVTF